MAITKPRAKKRKSTAPTSDKARSTNAARSTLRLNFDQRQNQVRPNNTSISRVYPLIRSWAKDSSFLRMYWPLKLSILNYGLQIMPGEDEDPAKLNEWLDEYSTPSVDEIVDTQTQETVEVKSFRTNREMIESFVASVWMEWFMFDSVVSLWHEQMPFPVILPIERIEYQDVFGVELVRYTHGLGEQDIARLADDMQKRFKDKTVISLNPKEGEYFKVLKRANLGEGLGMPGIYSIFRLLDEIDSKEFGYSAMAFMFRSAKRHHKLGHEIKSGDKAGKPSHFWNPKRDAAVKACWLDIVGVDDFTSNFDHTIEYPWPDPKLFDEVVWKGSDRRIYQWAGPLGQMLIASGVTNYLPQLLRAEALAERNKVGRFLEPVILEAFDAPVEKIRLTWDNTIFTEARLQAELIKFGVQQGFVSNTTAKEQMGLDPEREEARKITEVDDPDVIKKHRPVWDTSHALAPAQGETAATMAEKAAAQKAKDGKNGKPAGTKDSDSQQV